MGDHQGSVWGAATVTEAARLRRVWVALCASVQGMVDGYGHSDGQECPSYSRVALAGGVQRMVHGIDVSVLIFGNGCRLRGGRHFAGKVLGGGTGVADTTFIVHIGKRGWYAVPAVDTALIIVAVSRSAAEREGNSHDRK